MNEVIIHFTENISKDPSVSENGHDEKRNTEQKQKIGDGDVQQVGVRYGPQPRRPKDGDDH